MRSYRNNYIRTKRLKKLETAEVIVNTSEPTATVETHSSQNKNNGGINLYGLDNTVSKCPKCFQNNSVHRETDQYGIYDTCRTCGWLDNIRFHTWWTHIEPSHWKSSTPTKVEETSEKIPK